jgi:DNA-binding FadR family transcriptional regulator
MATSSGRPPKTAVIVTQRIIGDVVRNNIEPGDSLPPERTMMEKYQIGRGTLREALRLLETQGVIALKPGPGGGPILLRPDGSHLASTLALLMQLSNAPFRVIIEARSALEPMIGRLAAARISDTQLAELRESVDKMAAALDDEYTFLESNKKFHDVIAWSSGNPLFGYLIDSLLGILDGTVVGMDYPLHRRKAILKAHEEILAAVQQHDEDAAEQRMREHTDAYVKFARRKYPDLFEQVIAWDRMS